MLFMPKAAWSADCTKIPVLKIHTKKKHEILRDYIRNWVLTLGGNNRLMGMTITIVDGFCGGGIYQDGDQKWLGSPLLILQSILNGLQDIQEKKSKPNFQLDFRVICIDNDRKHIACLKKVFYEYGYEKYLDKQVLFYTSKFADIIEQVIDITKERKGASFFFLDPFGYTDFSMEIFRKILGAKDKTEILLTYMVDEMSRFLSDRKFTQKLESENYYLDLENPLLKRNAKQEYLRNETIRLFRERTSVPFVFTFSLLSKDILAKYYLIHLSHHPKAISVLKETLWKYNNLFQHYGYNPDVIGHSTPIFLKERYQSHFIDIIETNRSEADNFLKELILKTMYSSQNLSFQDLIRQTIEKNPSSIEMYQDVFASRDLKNKIVIKRNRQALRSRKPQMTDILEIHPQRYFYF